MARKTAAERHNLELREELEAAHQANLELRTQNQRIQALNQSTAALSDLRLRDLTTAQGQRDQLKRSVADLTQAVQQLRTPARSTRRVVRTLVIEGNQVWVAETLSRALAEGITHFGTEGAITLTTTEDQLTWLAGNNAPPIAIGTQTDLALAGDGRSESRG